MAIEEQKMERQISVFNEIVAGFAKGLYDIFDDSALAMANTLGLELLKGMEQDLGLEISAEDPQELLREIESLLLDEYGFCEAAAFDINDGYIDMKIEECQLWQATEKLLKADVPPYTCIPMMMASASLQNRLGMISKYDGIEQDTGKHICNIKFLTKQTT